MSKKAKSIFVNFKPIICLVGLGYVGLPLAVEFGKSKFKTYGLDVNEKRINTLKKGIDYTEELSKEELEKSKIIYSTDPKIIQNANFIIIAVPTPVDDAKKPDLSLVEKASINVGRNLKKGSIVVFESTVYPGVTEDICLPIIEKESGLKGGIDFKIGYSPERINPGDKEHTVDKIVKIVSGQDQESLEIIANTYEEIITAGIFKASSIKVAEAAKVIENTQRDINIGLINELAVLFHKLNINTNEVLEAAGTKWNFLKFKPGLVGGHCIGVDPYYLVHKAEMVGVKTRLISSGREINDNIPYHIANRVIKMLIKNNKQVKEAKILVMGLTFKENVRDFRNSKCKVLIEELKTYGVEVVGYDPFLTKEQVNKEFNIENTDFEKISKMDGIIYAVNHKSFTNISIEILRKKCTSNPILFDIKNRFPIGENSGFLVEYL